MTITPQTRMYEVLVRYNPDGSVAAHQATITELVDDSTTPPTIHSATINLPTALDPAQVQDVVGVVIPALQAQVAALQAQVAQMTNDHQAALAAAEDDKTLALSSAAADKLAALDAAHEDKTATVASVQSQLDEATAQISTLSGQLYSAQDALRVMTSDRDAHAAQIAALTEQFTEIQGQLSAAQADAQQKSTALADMTSQRDAASDHVTALQAQVAELTAPPTVPSVDMWMFKLALLQTPSFTNQGATLLSDAEALVARSPQSVQIMWSAPKVARNNKVLCQMAALLVPAPNDPAVVLDQLFVLAPTLG